MKKMDEWDRYFYYYEKLHGCGAGSAIIKALKEQKEYPKRVIEDIAFHMMDWLGDLSVYYAFCRAPDRWRPGEIRRILSMFLQHVPEHVAAAAKLMNYHPVRDIFHVGAVECEKCSKTRPSLKDLSLKDLKSKQRPKKRRGKKK